MGSYKISILFPVRSPHAMCAVAVAPEPEMAMEGVIELPESALTLKGSPKLTPLSMLFLTKMSKLPDVPPLVSLQTAKTVVPETPMTGVSESPALLVSFVEVEGQLISPFVTCVVFPPSASRNAS